MLVHHSLAAVAGQAAPSPPNPPAFARGSAAEYGE